MTVTPKGTCSSTMLKTLLIMLATAAVIAAGFFAVLCGICSCSFDPDDEDDIDNEPYR